MTSTLFTLYSTATGRVLCAGTGADPLALASSGESMLIGARHDAGWIDEQGQHHDLPAQTSPHHAWDWIQKRWVDPRTLGDLKATKWTAIKQARDAQEAGTFPFLDKFIDSNPRSVQRITTAVQYADAAQREGTPFAIEWTCADNSVLLLNGPAMQGMPVALAQYANTLHERARALRSQIEAATSTEELDAIAW